MKWGKSKNNPKNLEYSRLGLFEILYMNIYLGTKIISILFVLIILKVYGYG